MSSIQLSPAVATLFKIVTSVAPKSDVEVQEEIRAITQNKLGELSVRGLQWGNSAIDDVFAVIVSAVERRETALLGAIRRALLKQPLREEDSPDVVREALADVGRYYALGREVLRDIVSHLVYYDGLPPSLDDHQAKVYGRLSTHIEIALAEASQRLLLTRGEQKPQRLPDDHVFIVHGRDETALKSVAEYVKSLDLVPIILREQPNRGRTIIEKFEEHSKVRFAIAILTGDDEGRLAAENASGLRRRPRQNVILELGFFLGSLGRHNVCVLFSDGIDAPSDYNGVAYVALDANEQWKNELRRELIAAGFSISG
jgi:predicted nucleotide-binding protein